MRLRLHELGIGVTHLLRERRDELVEKRCVHTKLFAVPNGAADDAAQHVATTFVARQHAVNDQKGTGADMVGNNVERALPLVFTPMVAAAASMSLANRSIW